MDKDNDGCLTRLEIKYILMMENCPGISTDDSKKISFFNKDMVKNGSKYKS
jgi:Ca2+-binding EF-hand superfamily protein